MSETIAKRVAFLKENKNINVSFAELQSFREENKAFFKKVEEGKDVSGTSKLNVKGKPISVGSKKVVKILIGIFRDDESAAIKDLVQKKYVKSKKPEINEAFNEVFKSSDTLVGEAEALVGDSDVGVSELSGLSNKELIKDIEDFLIKNEEKKSVLTEEEKKDPDAVEFERIVNEVVKNLKKSGDTGNFEKEQEEFEKLSPEVQDLKTQLLSLKTNTVVIPFLEQQRKKRLETIMTGIKKTERAMKRESSEQKSMMEQDFDATGRQSSPPPPPQNGRLQSAFDRSLQLADTLESTPQPQQNERLQSAFDRSLQLANTLEMGGEDRNVIDEPRPPQSDPTASSADNMDFSGESEEQRVEQIESVLSMIESTPLDVPAEIINSARQGIKIIKTAKSKKSAFSKVKSIAKGVLGFVALSPLPFPPQVKLGAGAILTGITAIEQTVALVKGESTETSAIKAALEAASNVDELAPVAEVATGIINAIEGIVSVRDQIVGEQENKDASESTPIPSNLVGEGLSNTKAVQATIVGEALQESEGQLNLNEVNDTTASSVDVPISIMEGDTIQSNIDPTLAKKLAVEKEEGKPEDVETQIELEEQVVPTSDVLSGNRQIQGFYENPIHPDALGIFFGSSSFPKWDTSLLNDRKDRFKDMSPESVAPFLLQQTQMIHTKYGVDLLIPKLIFGAGSDPLQIEKENMEVLQLWARFNKISKGDSIGVKLGDLLKFRGLISEGAGPSASNPLSSGEPGEQPTEASGTVPTSQAQTPEATTVKSIHPKDTTKNFLYAPGAIRLGPKITDAEARKAAIPSLAEVTTLAGAPQLQTRRNQTRGWSHSGPAARSVLMNQVRSSVVGTASRDSCIGYTKQGFSLQQNLGNFKVKVRTHNSSHLEDN